MKGKPEFFGHAHPKTVSAPASPQGAWDNWRSFMNAFDFPPDFRTSDITTNGTSIHVRSGGTGPAVILLHGYGETGDMWAPMAVDLARDHTVVVPDLRGMGLSSKPAGGF